MRNNPVPENPTLVKPKPQKLSFGKKMLIAFIIFFIVGLAAKIIFGSVYVYSKGARTGYIYKFSKKGYIFKTYEGTLKTGFVNMGNPLAPNEEWKFSVADADVAKQIEQLDDRKMVKIHYHEYLTRLFWRGDTKYFVYKLEILP